MENFEAPKQKSPPTEALNFERLSEAEQLRRSLAFYETMRKRRTVREFSSDPVPYELIENAIKVAASAPSGANQQPWKFVVVSNPEIKRKIREAAEVEEKEFYSGRAPDEWLEALAVLGTDWEKPFLETAPYLIVGFRVDYGLSMDSDGQELKIKHYYVVESVGIACGILLAALHMSGLATLTHTPSPMGFGQDSRSSAQREAVPTDTGGISCRECEGSADWQETALGRSAVASVSHEAGRRDPEEERPRSSTGYPRPTL